MFKNPKTPVWEKAIYRTRPTKTGGNAIIALKNIKIVFLPWKFFDESMPAIGNPKRQEINKADTETFRDNQIISNKSGSNDNMSLNESAKILT